MMLTRACIRCAQVKPLAEFDREKKSCRGCLQYYKDRYNAMTPEQREIISARSARAMRRLRLRRGFMRRSMWVGVDLNGNITAAWFPGCEQGFRPWKRAVIALGYRPISGEFRQVR